MEWKLAAKILSLSRRGCIATWKLTAAKRQTWQRRRLSEASNERHRRACSEGLEWFSTRTTDHRTVPPRDLGAIYDRWQRARDDQGARGVDHRRWWNLRAPGRFYR